MTFDALRAFALFADHLNFTRAAAELHISQPALHVKVNKLAAAIGRPLYVRDGRRLLLTDDGRSVARFARRLDGETAEFLSTFAGAKRHEPVIVAAGEGAFLYVIAGAVRQLLDRGEQIRLVTADREETIGAIRSGRASIGVTVLASAPRGLRSVPIASYPQVAVLPATHPLSHKRSLVLTDLSGAALIVAPPQRPQRQALERALNARGVEWSVAVEAQGWPQMLHFVSLGVGICVVNGCIDPGRDLIVRTIEDLPPVTYSALHRADKDIDRRILGVLDAIRSNAP